LANSIQAFLAQKLRKHWSAAYDIA
jgi:hypothetical protein